MSRTTKTLLLVFLLTFGSFTHGWFFGSSTEPSKEKVVVLDDQNDQLNDLLKEGETPPLKSSNSLPNSVDSAPSSSSSRIIADDAGSEAATNIVDDSTRAAHAPHAQHSDDHDAEFDHRAILGSSEKAEEFRHLSPMEAKKRLWALTKRMDFNGNGEVTEEELHKWIVQSLKTLNEEESLRRYKDHDQDDDGKLGWEEYLKSFYGYVPDEEMLLSKFEEDAAHFYKVFREDDSKFRDADVDGDGSLTSLEFRAFSHPEDFVHMHRNFIARLVNETDADGDGAIDLNEFLKHGDDGGVSDTDAEAEEWRAIEADRFLRGLDQDSNLKLEGPELAAWAVPNIIDVARDEAAHLIYAADKNRDAVLSVEEILNEYDLFVGSAATDYGQHLNDEL